MTTAVFNAAEDAIVAGLDSHENGLAVLDLNTLDEISHMNLSFPGLSDEISVDKYRLFWISEPYKNHYAMFAAYYEGEDDLNENIGRTLMIWVGQDINRGTTLENLKGDKKVKAFCWPDRDHQNDDKIPSFSVQWMGNPQDEEVI